MHDADLPRHCYSHLRGTGQVIIIKRGVRGYYKSGEDTGDESLAAEIAAGLNAQLGISKQHVEQMEIRSAFHWVIA